MAGRHPLDAHGRVLPHPGWPDDRRAPGDLELVRRFCNSVNHENGAERFDDAAAFDAWLASEGLASPGTSTADLRRVLAVRDALHRLVAANAARVHDADAWADLAAALPGPSARFTAGPSGLAVTPTASVDGVLTRIGQAVAAAVADGSWPRLKACRHCRWVVFDTSKNRSSTWCSMSACGGRHNAREYRRRHRIGERAS